VDNGVVTETNAPTNGVIGGALGGYNWQNGALVLGLEGDFGWTNAHGNGAVPQSTEVRQYDFNWTSHVRGRAGFASGPWLAFVAGGLALAKLKMTMQQNGLTMTCEGGPYAGWSIGGGVDYTVNDRISVRLEYLYDDFGRKDYVIAANDVYQDRLTGNTVRGAINFKLWPH
jgi:outer membrane immunogenic protein